MVCLIKKNNFKSPLLIGGGQGGAGHEGNDVGGGELAGSRGRRCLGPEHAAAAAHRPRLHRHLRARHEVGAGQGLDRRGRPANGKDRRHRQGGKVWDWLYFPSFTAVTIRGDVKKSGSFLWFASQTFFLRRPFLKRGVAKLRKKSVLDILKL